MPSIKAIVLPLTPGMTSAEPIQKPFIIKFNFLKNIKCKYFYFAWYFLLKS